MLIRIAIIKQLQLGCYIMQTFALYRKVSKFLRAFTYPFQTEFDYRSDVTTLLTATRRLAE